MANATYFVSHGVDEAEGLTFAMDLTPLIKDPDIDIKSYVLQYIKNFSRGIEDTISSVLWRLFHYF